jgi:hypothetical protein
LVREALPGGWTGSEDIRLKDNIVWIADKASEILNYFQGGESAAAAKAMAGRRRTWGWDLTVQPRMDADKHGLLTGGRRERPTAEKKGNWASGWWASENRLICK